MGKAPAFQFYAADFLFGTARMSNEHVGVYIRLLCHQWDGGPMTLEEARSIVGQEIPQTVIKKFEIADGRMFNVRLEAERKKQEEFRQVQSERGRAGADARWHRDGTAGVPSDNGTSNASANGTSNGRKMALRLQSSSSVSGLQSSTSKEPAGPGRDRPEDLDLPDWRELDEFRDRSVEPLSLDDQPEQVKGKLSGKRAYEPIDESWLRNSNDLAAWHRWQLTLSQPVLGKSVAHLLLVLCAAEHALALPKESVRKNRVAVFVNCIKRKDWASLRDRFPRALKRLEAMP